MRVAIKEPNSQQKIFFSSPLFKTHIDARASERLLVIQFTNCIHLVLERNVYIDW